MPSPFHELLEWWGSPYINHFLQPDTIIPNLSNPQSLNRFSYVINNPLRYTDPTGHSWEDCGGRSGYRCRIHMNQVGKIKAGWAAQEAAQQNTNPCATVPWTCGGSVYGPGGGGSVNSSVPIIFGRPGDGRNTMGIASGGSVGVGVIVDDMLTIVTAGHVYLDNLVANSHDTLWVQVSGRWVTYAIADLEIVFGRGDLVTITLPSKLPGYVIPAHIAGSYDSKAGQSVVTTYMRPVLQGDDIAAFTLYSMTTTTFDPPSSAYKNPYGWQLLIVNANDTLIHGDSGGGVFYDGQLIGVNSTITDSHLATVAPLCWNWFTGLPC